MQDSRSGRTAASGRKPTPRPDSIAEALAAEQHGVVSRPALLALGISTHIIDHRVRTGRWTPIHRGVYRIGPTGGRYEREMAALLACGDSAVLSHGTAAELWNIRQGGRRNRGPVDVTLRRGWRERPGAGLRIHRLRSLQGDECSVLDGLAITTPTRTVVDLASVMGPADLERAIGRAAHLGLTDAARVRKVLQRHPNCRGARALRAVLGLDGGPAFTRSDAEARLLSLVRRAGLPTPRTNQRRRGIELDVVWDDHRLVVEIDGYRYHGSRDAFERDRRRDADLTAAGYRVVRVTWRQITREPEIVVARIAQALVRAEGPPSG